MDINCRTAPKAGGHRPPLQWGGTSSVIPFEQILNTPENRALLSVPTPEHYLPLLYILGASVAGERVSFPVEGVDGGSVSMLAVQFGA